MLWYVRIKHHQHTGGILPKCRPAALESETSITIDLVINVGQTEFTVYCHHLHGFSEFLTFLLCNAVDVQCPEHIPPELKCFNWRHGLHDRELDHRLACSTNMKYE